MVKYTFIFTLFVAVFLKEDVIKFEKDVMAHSYHSQNLLLLVAQK